MTATELKELYANWHSPHTSESEGELFWMAIRELEKLEQARKDLYDYLEDKLTEFQLGALTNYTGQIWKVANTRW